MNIDFLLIPEEQRYRIDIHSYTLEEAIITIKNTLDNLEYGIRVIVVIHGYSTGSILLKGIRNDLNHNRIEKIVPSLNPGVTLIYLKENYVIPLRKIKRRKYKKKRKMRYLNETAVQIEILKWLALLAIVAVYDMNPYCKICLGIIFLTDLGATKYSFDDLALKILMITLILSAFIADMTIMNASVITKLLVVLIIIGVAGYKYIQYYNDYKITSKERGDLDEK